MHVAPKTSIEEDATSAVLHLSCEFCVALLAPSDQPILKR